METAKQNHNCSECAWKRKVVIENVDKDDVSVYETIMTGISTAQAARNQNNFNGENVSSEMMKAYFSTIMDREEHYKKLEIEWWRKMIEKYKISDFTKIDVMKSQFYICVDEDKNEKIEFSPKEIQEESETAFEKQGKLTFI
jgi:hypothetical protein